LKVYSVGPYRGFLRSSVVQLKKRQRVAWARHLGQLLGEALERELTAEQLSGRVVTAVPSAPSRKRYRGFNPAGLVADGVAARLGLPCADLLECLGDPAPVKNLDRAQRLAGEARFRARAAVPPRVLLVDDVMTTGGTLLQARQALGECDLLLAVVAVAVTR